MKKEFFFNLRVLIKILLICFSALIPRNSHAQDGELQATVTLKILKIGYNGADKKKKARPVWKFYHHDKAGMSLTNAKAGDCYEFKSKRKNDDDDVNEDESEVRPFISSFPSFCILMECYASTKGMGGQVCTYDQNDGDHSLTYDTLRPFMDKLSPGEWSDQIKVLDNKGIFYAFFQYKYVVSELGKIISPSKEDINDASNSIELSLSSQIPNKEILPFRWGYSVDNSSWKEIPNSNADKSILKLDPIKDIFDGKLETTKKIYFRASIDNKGTTLNSNETSFSFTPAAPTSNDTSTTSSCHSASSGRILVKNIKSFCGKINYVLRKADNLKAPCNLQDSTNCPGFIKKGYVLKGTNIDLTSLQAGSYDLIMYNGEMEVGNVYSSLHFIIDELPELKIKPNSYIRQPTCLDEQGGGISLVVEGGKNLWQIILTPKAGNLSWYGEDKISIDQLSSGSYILELTDKCGNLVTKNFLLRKPRKLAVDSIVLNSKPLELTVILKSGSGSGNYKLTVTDQATNNQKNSDNISDIIIPLVDAGVYRVQITDNAYPNCPSIDTLITIKKTGSLKSPKYQVGGQDGAKIYFRKNLRLQEIYAGPFMAYLNRRKFLPLM